MLTSQSDASASLTPITLASSSNSETDKKQCCLVCLTNLKRLFVKLMDGLEGVDGESIRECSKRLAGESDSSEDGVTSDRDDIDSRDALMSEEWSEQKKGENDIENDIVSDSIPDDVDDAVGGEGEKGFDEGCNNDVGVKKQRMW